MIKMMSTAKIVVPLAVLQLSSFAPGAAQTHFDDRDAQFTFSKVEFPAVADTFAVMSTRRWPQPARGVVIHYESPIAPAAHLDLYVSPLDRVRGSDGSIGERVRREFERSLEGIQLYIDINREDTEVVVESTDSTVITGASGREYVGWVADVTLTTGSKSERSLLYLFEKNGSSVKYRITHERSLRSMLHEHIDAFVRETLERIQPRQVDAPDTPEALVELAQECATREDPISCLAPHVTERVYFPQAIDLRGASDACAEAYEVARERDGGHGWYHTPEHFLTCLWTAEEPYPGIPDALPRDVLLECINEGELVILGDRFARLETRRFMLDMMKEDGRWVFEQLLLKP